MVAATHQLQWGALEFSNGMLGHVRTNRLNAVSISDEH